MNNNNLDFLRNTLKNKTTKTLLRKLDTYSYEPRSESDAKIVTVIWNILEKRYK